MSLKINFEPAFMDNIEFAQHIHIRTTCATFQSVNLISRSINVVQSFMREMNIVRFIMCLKTASQDALAANLAVEHAYTGLNNLLVGFSGQKERNVICFVLFHFSDVCNLGIFRSVHLKQYKQVTKCHKIIFVKNNGRNNKNSK